MTLFGTLPYIFTQIWHPDLGANGGKHLANSNVDPIWLGLICKVENTLFLFFFLQKKQKLQITNSILAYKF